MEGLITLGFNPLLAGPDVNRLVKAMSNLKWKVVIDPFMLDSAEFWKAPGVDPATVQTEVLYLPSTHWIERDGSFTNSGRWAQWKEAAVEPPSHVRSDTWILAELFWRVKERYAKDGGTYPDGIQAMTWRYANPRLPTLSELAKEINGSDQTTGQLLSSFGQLKDDGTTTSGNWLYTGSYTEAGNQMARRDTADPTGMGFHHGWAWNWPLNRRVLYNRASADAEGKPWDPTRPGIWWNGQRWSGDVPDYGPTMPPGQNGAFIMTEEGVARLFTRGLKDGPFGEHYEPVESPTKNLLHEKVAVNPAINWYEGVKDTLANGDGDYPYPCCVYRVVEREHFVTSNVPYLVEAMPDFFVELPVELAEEKGIENGGRVKVRSKRGEVEGVAIVTRRIQPLMVNGKATYTVGVPVHWGFVGLTKGSMANNLTPFIGDANTRCPEFKAFLVDVERA
jgi:formate dehydrogenase major subunit